MTLVTDKQQGDCFQEPHVRCSTYSQTGRPLLGWTRCNRIGDPVAEIKQKWPDNLKAQSLVFTSVWKAARIEKPLKVSLSTRGGVLDKYEIYWKKLQFVFQLFCWFAITDQKMTLSQQWNPPPRRYYAGESKWTKANQSHLCTLYPVAGAHRTQERLFVRTRDPHQNHQNMFVIEGIHNNESFSYNYILKF